MGIALVDGDEECFFGDCASLQVDIYLVGSLFLGEVEIEGVALLVGSEEGLEFLLVPAVAL